MYCRQLPATPETHEMLIVRCVSCGAETHLAQDTTAGKCSFCGSGVVAEGQSKKAIKPMGLLPFLVTRDQANQAFRRWIASLWFAPNALTQTAERAGIDGAYIPAWTYNAETVTQYVGERGDDYQEMETYTEYVNGQPVTQTRMVTRTRWSGAMGTVADRFRDLLVLATQTLPAKQAQHLQPWDLDKLVPYADEYLSGLACQSYQVDLVAGFESAKGLMAPVIQNSIRANIGGDHQRILSSSTQYGNVKFRHLLLPLWISAYKYNNQVYRFLVNARTGQVQGERPFSAIKIAILVASIIVGLIIVMMIVRASQGR
jgi:DNA-directed RNA polymerase subunit RPC12/RpoP